MNRTNKSFKKIIWSAVVIIILAGTIYFLFFDRGSNEVVVHSDKVVLETLMQRVSATGTINPIQTVEVGTQVSGTIDKLYVDFNDQVKAGQIIARMDTRNLTASVKESEARLLQAEVQLKQAKRALDRTTGLFENRTVAKVDMEKAEDDYQLALTSYNSAELQLERNKVDLGYATITSPIDGIVISRKVDEGQTVAAAFTTPAIYIIAKDLKEMKIEASVDEADIGHVRKGQSVIFTVDAFPDEIFQGEVDQIQLQPVTLQNVVTYTVEIIVSNQELKLLPGMTATLEIIISSRENVLTVPNGVFGFVMEDELRQQVTAQDYEVISNGENRNSTIWKIEGKTFTEMPVHMGYSNGIKTEITGAISESDAIVNSIEVITGKPNSGRSFFMPTSQEEDINQD